jgi:flagellar basal-body rod protein FlgF
MPYGFYISAEGANAQSTRLDVIANNLANVDTVGFKRDLAICQARYAEAVKQGLVSPGSGKIDDVGGGILVSQTKTDFSPGKLKQTKTPSDVAILGDGFFKVKKGNDVFLTRAGNFEITSRGELVTPQGYAVLDETGTPVVLNPDEKEWQINDTGSLIQRSSTQNLAIVKPASTDDLVRYGENLFKSTSEAQAVAQGERKVASGYLEMSGVHPTLEMTALIEASRYLEININMMKTQDQMLDSLVNRVLKA